jgi:hypothetical protein
MAQIGGEHLREATSERATSVLPAREHLDNARIGPTREVFGRTRQPQAGRVSHVRARGW